MENTLWLIWSIEHNGWWKHKGFGYTENLLDAGVFSYTKALEIIDGANIGLKQGHNKPNEAMILLTPELKKVIDEAF